MSRETGDSAGTLRGAGLRLGENSAGTWRDKEGLRETTRPTGSHVDGIEAIRRHESPPSVVTCSTMVPPIDERES